MHIENRSCQDSDKLRELSAKCALLRSYQHERTQTTPPCAISRRPRKRRPEQLLQKRPQSFSWGSNYLGGQDCDRPQSFRGMIRVRSTYDFWRPKNTPRLWTDHHTWWGGQTEGTTKKENRVLTIYASPPPSTHLRLFWREKNITFFFGRIISHVKIVSYSR